MNRVIFKPKNLGRAVPFEVTPPQHVGVRSLVFANHCLDHGLAAVDLLALFRRQDAVMVDRDPALLEPVVVLACRFSSCRPSIPRRGRADIIADLSRCHGEGLQQRNGLAFSGKEQLRSNPNQSLHYRA
jgi:hypothetical protein